MKNKGITTHISNSIPRNKIEQNKNGTSKNSEKYNLSESNITCNWLCNFVIIEKIKKSYQSMSWDLKPVWSTRQHAKNRRKKLKKSMERKDKIKGKDHKYYNNIPTSWTTPLTSIAHTTQYINSYRNIHRCTNTERKTTSIHVHSSITSWIKHHWGGRARGRRRHSNGDEAKQVSQGGLKRAREYQMSPESETGLIVLY